MREILFKGKRIDNGEWVEGMPINNHIGTFMCFDENPHYCHQYGYMEIDKIIQVDPETVCQHTGLTDKNRTKIFEGDIVKATILENSGFGTRRYTKDYIIKYHEKYCYFYLARERNNLLFDGNWSYAVKEFEVIGNIFDNPELLKEGVE